jgi:hypothetical protein
MSQKKMTFGLIVGNRGFFPCHVAKSGREEMIGALQSARMEAVVLIAANLATVASSVHEATTRYLGWDMYWHRNHEGC